MPAGLSPVIAGAWRLAEWAWTPQQRLAWIEGNLDIGVSSFDHADIAGGHAVERLFGEALALKPGLRQRLQLVGTCAIPQPTPAQPGPAAASGDMLAAQVRASVERSLRELRTAHLDLLLIQHPGGQIEPEALAQTFEALRGEGKVRGFGVSNFAPHQLAPLHRRFALATAQIECSPLHLDPLHDGRLDQCADLGLRPMLWSPLAGGRVFTGQDPRAQRVRATVQAMAAELGLAPITLITAWLRRHPSQPLPILGSRRIEVAREAMAALAVTLDAPQWQRLWEAAAEPLAGRSAGHSAGAR